MKLLVIIIVLTLMLAFVVAACFSAEKQLKETNRLAEEERKKFEEQMEKALAEMQDKDINLDNEED